MRLLTERERLQRGGAKRETVTRSPIPGSRIFSGVILSAFVLLGLFQSSAPVLLAGMSPSVATQYAPADGWPQFRGNHQNTGVSTSPMPATFKQLWTYEAGESIESSAAIYGGTVFVGSQKGELVALDLESGSVKWKYSTKEPIGESSPCVGNGAVYIGDLSGVLHAVNLNDGKGLWT